jgi:hypothetical protein
LDCNLVFIIAGFWSFFKNVGRILVTPNRFKARENSCSHATRDASYLVEQDDKWLHIQQSLRKIVMHKSRNNDWRVLYLICQSICSIPFWRKSWTHSILFVHWTNKVSPPICAFAEWPKSLTKFWFYSYQEEYSKIIYVMP